MEHLPTIYAAAVLLPLASFFVILLFARQLGRFAAWIATGAILGEAVLSFFAFGIWLNHSFPEPVHHGGHSAVHEEGHGQGRSGAGDTGTRDRDRRQGTRDRGRGGDGRRLETHDKTGHVGASAFSLVALIQEPAGSEAPHAAGDPRPANIMRSRSRSNRANTTRWANLADRPATACGSRSATTSTR